MAPLFFTVMTILSLAWIGGIPLFTHRIYAAQTAYLRRLPASDGVTVNYGRNDWLRSKRHVRRRQIYKQQQADPELEQLRREVWRYIRYLMFWGFGWPVVITGVTLIVVFSYSH